LLLLWHPLEAVGACSALEARNVTGRKVDNSRVATLLDSGPTIGDSIQLEWIIQTSNIQDVTVWCITHIHVLVWSVLLHLSSRSGSRASSRCGGGGSSSSGCGRASAGRACAHKSSRTDPAFKVVGALADLGPPSADLKDGDNIVEHKRPSDTIGSSWTRTKIPVTRSPTNLTNR